MPEALLERVELPAPLLRLDRGPETGDELWWMVYYLWGVSIPRHSVCPDHVAPFTAFADAYFRRNSINDSGIDSIALWLGSRGLSGKSFLLSILGLTISVLRGSDVNLLGGSFAQSTNIHTHIRMALESEHAPRYMIATEAATEIKFHNKARIHPLTASQRTVRGPHPPQVLLDEIDEMELTILDAALGQPMPQTNWLGELIRPHAVLCSTHQHPEGTVTEIKRRAEARGIPSYSWCFLETSNPIDGWLSKETIEEKRASIPAEMWRTEYELGEPAIGNRAFDTAAVDRTFSLDFEPIKTKESKDFEEYTFAEPVKHGTYIATADWGKERDYTVIGVWRLDEAPRRLVYYMRVNRRPYPQMVGWFNDAIRRYHVPDSGAWHDGTGLGNVVNDYLDHRARAFVMTGEKRDILLSKWVSAVEGDKWRIPRIKSMYIEHKYARVGDLYSRAASQYHLPDSVCMAALAEHAAARIAPVVSPIVVARSDEPTAFQRNFVGDQERDRNNAVTTEPINLVVF